MNIKTRISNEDRSTLTRAALLKAARKLFVEKGYADTGTPELVKAAGVTRGALYHHFEDKKALFRAVVEAECRQIADAIRGATSKPASAMEALKQGARAYFDAMQKKGRVQLVLIEGPAALGLGAVQQISDQTAGETLSEGITAAIDSCEIRELPISALSTLLDAALDRAALEIANGAPRTEIEAAVDALLDGLATAPSIRG
jgi:AcrR family transcriptional regulator